MNFSSSEFTLLFLMYPFFSFDFQRESIPFNSFEEGYTTEQLGMEQSKKDSP